MHLRLCRIKGQSGISTSLDFVYGWRGKAVNTTGVAVIQILMGEPQIDSHTHPKLLSAGLSVFFCSSVPASLQ